MKLLFDENLSPRLPRALADLYPDSAHVHECGLGSADDARIWDYAKQNGFTIVSKDSDFQDRSVLHGHRQSSFGSVPRIAARRKSRTCCGLR